MFITGFLHSGASIISDFIRDVLNPEFTNGGDECYFLRENGAAVDMLFRNEIFISDIPLQSNLRYKLYILKLLLLNKASIKTSINRYNYNKKCILYWTKINSASRAQDKINLINQFYTDTKAVSINAITLDMPDYLLENLFDIHLFFFPLRNIFSQLQDIERQNFFFGPFDYNVEYILGKYDMIHIRRYAYLDLLESRLNKLKFYRQNENICIVDVERLLTDSTYRSILCHKLDVDPNHQSYKNLNLTIERPWIYLSEDDFFNDERNIVYHGSLKEKVIGIQQIISELKCG